MFSVRDTEVLKVQLENLIFFYNYGLDSIVLTVVKWMFVVPSMINYWSTRVIAFSMIVTYQMFSVYVKHKIALMLYC